MANPSNSWFPLLESDQAEVIEIFNELMQRHGDASNPAAALAQKPAGPSRDVRDDLGNQQGIFSLD
jgi:hypothetical protein